MVVLPHGGKAKRFRITRRIGSGNWAFTYEAVDPITDEHVAVKILRPGIGNRRSAAGILGSEIIEWEGQRLRELGSRHPSLVKGLGVGYLEDSPREKVSVLELIRGRPSTRARDGSDRLPIGEAARLSIEVLEGLRGLGRRHNDIQPDNVLLEGDPRSPRARIVDLGAVTAVGEDYKTDAPSRYIAPEVRLADPGSPRGRRNSDIYSTFAVMLHLVTGKDPAIDPERRLDALLAEVPDLVVRRDGRAVRFHDVVRKGMAADPRRRYRSIDEAIAALEPFVAAADARALPAPRATAAAD